jgi:hypothetical protein
MPAHRRRLLKFLNEMEKGKESLIKLFIIYFREGEELSEENFLGR